METSLFASGPYGSFAAVFYGLFAFFLICTGTMITGIVLVKRGKQGLVSRANRQLGIAIVVASIPLVVISGLAVIRFLG